jgi:phosphohistidine phosphatase SixA
MKTYPNPLATLVLTLTLAWALPSAAQEQAAKTPKAASRPPATVVNPKIPRLSDIAGAENHKFLADLKKGGYVIFFRHAATDWTQRDRSYSDFENRAEQRNLSEAGKAEAAAVGKAFTELGIEIDSVFVSPMWRCRDTAQIAFGRYEKKIELFGKVPPSGPEGVAVMAENRAKYRAERLKMLGTAPAKGMNRVLVGQQDPMIPIIPGLHRDELREGDALVILPLGKGGFRVVAQVTPADWTRLAAAGAK